MQKQKEDDRVSKMQRLFFGKRYVGASLSKLRGIADESVKRIAEWIKKPSDFLVLLGPPGTGKTYFCAALLESLPKGIDFVRAYTERNLLGRVRDSFNDGINGDYMHFLEDLLDDDLIIIDDIGATGRNDWREEILFDAVDYRYSIERPTILTSNLSREEFEENYQPRLLSRMFAKENVVIELFEHADLRQEGF